MGMLVVERLDVARWGPQRVEHWVSIGRCLDACSVGICSSVVLHRVLLGSCNARLPAGGPQPATGEVS